MPRKNKELLKIYRRQYYLKHREEEIKKSIQWKLLHPKELKGRKKSEETKRKISRSLTGKHRSEEVKKHMGKRHVRGEKHPRFGMFGNKSPTWKGGKKLARKRNNYKRRNLGHIFMNEPFENSEGHHLDNDFVLHIPKELHRSVPHNLTTGYNMELINTLAFEWIHSQLSK